MDLGISLEALTRLDGVSLPTTISLAVALASLALVPLAVRELAGVPWPERRRDLSFGAALYALAFALRWGLASHSIVHENHHGYHHVMSLMPVNESAATHGVASSHLLLLRLFASVFGAVDRSTFLFNTLLSSAAVVALAAYAGLVTRTRHAAVAAGALLALQPLAVALGPTDEFLVSASGLCLSGMALLHPAARFDLRATLALGTGLLYLGAAAREVTLPLSLLALPALLSARSPRGSTAWQATLMACLALLLLLPQTLQVLSAWRAQAATPGYFGAPALPWLLDGRRDHLANPHWLGWTEPFIPRWEAWAMLVAPALLAAWCAVRREPRVALGILLPAAIAMAQGGLVNSGWFPTHLRHQLLSMAMLLLPVAGVFGALAREVPPRLLRLLPLLLMIPAASFARRERGYHLELPLTQEYLFFQRSLAAAPSEGVAVTFDEDPLTHLPESWLLAQRPRWAMVRSDALPAALASDLHRPVYLLLDRACFLDLSCFAAGTTGCGDPRLRSALPSVATPYGRVTPQCARALAAAPWRVVATRELHRTRGAQLEMPSLDERVRIALLRWDRP